MSHFSHAVGELINQVSNANEQNIRLVQPLTHVPPFACIDWLEAQPHYPKFYWQSRDTLEEVVALGQVHTFSDPAPAYTILGENQRIWGGKSFEYKKEDKGNEPCCGDKASTYFFLPQIELVRLGGAWSLCVNLATNKEMIIESLNLLSVEAAPVKPISTQVTSISHCPTQELWNDQIHDALEKIEQDQFKKVVLARKTHVELDTTISASQLLKVSRENNKDSFHFLLALNDKQAFIGSTPERLYSRNGQELETEALAGTIGRHENAKKDQELADWLTQDSKNLRENQYVVDDIVDRLMPHVESVKAQQNARLIRLRKVQHLKRKIQAHLKQGVNGVQLLSALQPTAAVAGLPRKEAIEYIENNEPFSRGWYSGSMGYISHEKAEFCVAIRSALVCGDEVHLYAGAGIIKGSKPDIEWAELDRKMATLLSLLQDSRKAELML